MHTRILLSLSIVVAAGASACAEPKNEETATALQRDLTLAASAPKLETAYPVELERLQPQVSRTRAPRRHVSAQRSARVDVDLEPIRPAVARPAVARPAVAIQPSPSPAVTAPEPLNGRELPPGKTVTLIPASSGPSTTTDPAVDEGLLMIQRGHWCPPPRPGVGVRRPPSMY